MHALIVYAHPEPRSFNAAMRDRAVRTLREVGWTVEVSDLHAMGFDPVPRSTDFNQRIDPEVFKYQAEQVAAVKSEQGFAAEIQAEIDKLIRADLLILQFPLWWFSVPAILKGWIDKVFAMGVVYGGDVGFYSRGRFKGRRAMLAFSTGGPREMYGPTGLNGLADVVLWPLENGVLNFVGYDVLPRFHAPGPARADDATRAAMLDRWAERLRTLDSTRKLDFHPLDDFDRDAGWTLRPCVQGRTVGQPGVG
jgi:NAD(P)H dehydrogenase (quinone)